jgi:hypothetical protein
MKVKAWENVRRYLIIPCDIEKMINNNEISNIISLVITETEKHGVNAILIYN